MVKMQLQLFSAADESQLLIHFLQIALFMAVN